MKFSPYTSLLVSLAYFLPSIAMAQVQVSNGYVIYYSQSESVTQLNQTYSNTPIDLQNVNQNYQSSTLTEIPWNYTDPVQFAQSALYSSATLNTSLAWQGSIEAAADGNGATFTADATYNGAASVALSSTAIPNGDFYYCSVGAIQIDTAAGFNLSFPWPVEWNFTESESGSDSNGKQVVGLQGYSNTHGLSLSGPLNTPLSSTYNKINTTLTGVGKAGTYTVTDAPILFGAGAGFANNSQSNTPSDSQTFQSQAGISFQRIRPIHMLAFGVNWTDSGQTFNGYKTASNLVSTFASFPNYDSATSQSVQLLSQDPQGNNETAFVNDMSSLVQTMKQSANSQDTAIIYFNTHGNVESLNSSFVSLGTTSTNSAVNPLGITDNVDSQELFEYLRQMPDSVRKIVIIDTCHAGGFADALAGIPNTALLASSSISTLSPVAPDGTGAFTDALIPLLQSGEYSLQNLANDANGQASGYLGQDLFNEDGGSSIFTGFTPQVEESSGFSGNLLAPSTAVPEPSIALALLLSAVPCLAGRRFSRWERGRLCVN